MKDKTNKLQNNNKRFIEVFKLLNCEESDKILHRTYLPPKNYNYRYFKNENSH